MHYRRHTQALILSAALTLAWSAGAASAAPDEEPPPGDHAVVSKGPCYYLGTIRGKTPRIVVNGVCFQTEEGEPFFPIADTAWMLVRLSNEEIAHYIQTRSEQGFNVIKFGPESDDVDLEQLAFIFDTLEAHHMYAELYVPAYGYAMDTLIENNLEFARTLAAAVQPRSNLFAYSLEGLDSPHGKRDPADMVQRLRGAWQGIREADPGRLITFHPRSGHSVADLAGVDPDLMDFYAVHRCSPGSILSLLTAEITRTPRKPVFLTEPVYEGRGAMCGCNTGCTAEQALEQIMESISAGAAGISYGHYAVWSFNLGLDGAWGVDPSPKGTPWREALHAPGAQRISALAGGL